ncbi:MAG: Gfo/Idh/MocA family oxidoreductase [Planctomycetaceae bacterium]|jgi:predicted dehydrogenase|nr:Gfo/Idh/MocA family oxidoreductase [Planctomycetaceae bacterium]
MNKTTRRDFLKQTAVAASAIGTIPYFLSSQQPALAQSASDRLRMGCIGVGSMGRGDAHGFNGIVDIVALCDVDSKHIEYARGENYGKRDSNGQSNPDTYKDYRKILERKDIDVVSVVTPDHWHVKIAIEALQAGKHVFCQKPLTLTIEENQLIRAACKRYNKVFQVGTQQRSQRDQFALATLMIRKGLLGKIEKIVCDISGAPTCGPIPKADVPATLDFEMWLGQAPLVEYIATAETSQEGRAVWPRNSRTHYEFRWWYEYSGGKFTDWGAHHVDCAMWALDVLGDGQGPVKFKPIVFEHPVPYKDGYPTEDNRYNVSHKFDIECLFDDRTSMHVTSDSPDGNGILFEGTKGRIHVNRERIKGKPFEEIKDNIRETFSDEEFNKLYYDKPFEGHKENFVRCIREGGIPVSDVFTHVQAMNVCHLCAIAARLGREVDWNPKTEKTGDSQSQGFIARQQRKGYEISRSAGTGGGTTNRREPLRRR